jgi:hypothetical protein
MRAKPLALFFLSPVLSGCLVLRAGGGATLQRGSGEVGRFDAEGGLVMPAPWGPDRDRLAVLALSRKGSPDREGWTLLAAEVDRCLEPRCRPDLADLPKTLSEGYGGGPGMRDVGVRLEGSRNYVGAAARATLRLLGPTGLTGEVTAGLRTGPEPGPSVGVHLLLEVDCTFF